VKTINKHMATDKSVRLIILVRIILCNLQTDKDTDFLPSNGARNAC
jgi:hypothetical protein